MTNDDKIIDEKPSLSISNEEIEGRMRIVKSLEESWLLIKVISETIRNEAKEQSGGFPSILLGTLAASMLRNALTEKGVAKAGEGVIRVDQNF